VDHAGEQTGEIDDDPVGRVRPHMSHAVATPDALGFEPRGEFDGRGGDLAPGPRPRRLEAIDHRGPLAGVGNPRGEQAYERMAAGGGFDDRLRRGERGLHGSISA
jgi:hypothetical protein